MYFKPQKKNIYSLILQFYEIPHINLNIFVNYILIIKL